MMRNRKKKRIIIFILIAFLVFSFSHTASATLPTFDAVNAALNELRNALMQSQFAQDIALAAERLNQLREQYLELVRFHSGFDELLHVWVGDATGEWASHGQDALYNAFVDFSWITPQIEILGNSQTPQDIRRTLELITGELPVSQARPYIPFEEMQIVESFQLAQEIRRSGERTRDAAQSISNQAASASPKGAVRLQAEALSKSLLLAQQSQEVMAKMMELQATQVEQVSRDEKRLERERIKFMDDAAGFIQNFLNAG